MTSAHTEHHSDRSDSAVSRPARYDRRGPSVRTLSVILPTYNESENLPILLDRLETHLRDFNYEIIVVDDNSPDGTWRIAEDRAAASPRIRSLRRIDERGLSSAVVAGMQMAEGRVFAVMDSDLQHDETALIDIVSPILDGDADIALGSREADGGSYGEWGRWRRFVSWTGKQLARRMLGITVDDPMSGYFAVSRERFDEVADAINPKGFKILLEFLARGPRPRAVEVGYEFRDRVHGTTKLTGSVVGAYLLALLDLVFGRMVSATFTAYALVGALGVGVRFGAFSALSSVGVAAAAIIAIELSVLTNYWLNNRFTFAEQRRRGRNLVTGLVPFHLIAAHGIVVQIGLIAAFGKAGPELLDAGIGLQLLGILVATTGNYFLNRTITWRQRLV